MPDDYKVGEHVMVQFSTHIPPRYCVVRALPPSRDLLEPVKYEVEEVAGPNQIHIYEAIVRSQILSRVSKLVEQRLCA